MTQNAESGAVPGAQEPDATEAGDQPAEDSTSTQTQHAGDHDQAEGDEDQEV